MEITMTVAAAVPIFLLSDFRTGSTMLRFALDAHPDICCPGELNMAVFCQHAFRLVELTTDDELASAADLLRLRLATVRQMTDQLMNAYCTRKGKSRWCEKSPNNTTYLNLIHAVFPDAQYICLFRHALDQVHSFLEMNDIEGRLEPYLSRHGGHIVTAAIDRWCSQAEKLLAFEHLHRSMAYRVRYEQLVEAPEEQLAGLMRFLGYEPTPGLSVMGFGVRHDRGPADLKVKHASKIDGDRTGKGRTTDLGAVPVGLRRRLSKVLADLGYAPLPTSPSS